MTSWVLVLYAIVMGIWWNRLSNYFVGRSAAGGILHGGNQLAAVALTGHLCDITMGMVLVPISRHSALASFFKLSISTMLTYHMLLAYTLFVLVTVHAILYVSWVAVFNSLSAGLRTVIPVLNPTYLHRETWPGNRNSLGIWRASLVFTGIAAVLIMAAIAVTTLPTIRRKNFNLFYFSHLFSIPMVVIICLHASTMLYCTAPGLAMWCLDWSMRVQELRKKLPGKISALGSGWYCVTVALPRTRLAGCSCRSPLAHFFIHHADSSLKEIHPFSTITHLAAQDASTPPNESQLLIQFLFRTSAKPKETTTEASFTQEAGTTLLSLFRRHTTQRLRNQGWSRSKEWTEKLASLADQRPPLSASSAMDAESPLSRQCDVDITLRLEGPYFSPAEPARYDSVICFVAGTGVTGAIAIGKAFVELQKSSSSSPSPSPNGGSGHGPQNRKRCVIIWSVREAESLDLNDLLNVDGCDGLGLEVKVFRTGKKGGARVDFEAELRAVVETGQQADEGSRAGDNLQEDGGKRTWVYICGPRGYLEDVKAVCKGWKNRRVDYYAAGWDP
ncbi:MAG: hypothetical protein Q9190_003779 [Brigantiaea leucoxantha]